LKLRDAYDAFLLDLDGVLYRGEESVPGAREGVAALRDADRRIVFLTNNSARTPERVVERLRGFGIAARPQEVVTSAVATAHLIASASDGEATAFVIGEEGLRHALGAAGIGIEDDPEKVDYVVVGWDRSLDYEKLRRASVLVRAGARLIATNADRTYPAPGGELWPGAGSLVAAVEAAADETAEIVGKPSRPLFDAAVERAGSRRALVVGDRIETDVAGAVGAGLDSALVLTGAAEVADLLDGDRLPVEVLRDLRDLTKERPEARIRDARDEDRDALTSLLESSGLSVSGVPFGIEGMSIAADDREIVAAAGAEVREGIGYVHSVATRGSVRGGFLGTLVVATAARRARTRGAERLVLLTEDAGGFFGRLGFQQVPRDGLPAWVETLARACSEGAVAMAREVRRQPGQEP
jgi:HAD superfamily hydrolase (TIGR01457 family)